jgi:hypothetical protein
MAQGSHFGQIQKEIFFYLVVGKVKKVHANTDETEYLETLLIAGHGPCTAGSSVKRTCFA